MFEIAGGIILAVVLLYVGGAVFVFGVHVLAGLFGILMDALDWIVGVYRFWVPGPPIVAPPPQPAFDPTHRVAAWDDRDTDDDDYI